MSASAAATWCARQARRSLTAGATEHPVAHSGWPGARATSAEGEARRRQAALSARLPGSGTAALDGPMVMVPEFPEKLTEVL